MPLCELSIRFSLKENWPLKDHSCHVCFKLTYWFQRRRLLNIFSIGSYVKTKSSHGGHLEFPIGKRFTHLVQDHPMIIPAKSQFNWLGGFWQEDFLNFSQWEHIMDPGSHVGFQISTKNTNLVENPSHCQTLSQSCNKFTSWFELATLAVIAQVVENPTNIRSQPWSSIKVGLQ
jgi:hypothetical protein